MFSQLLYSHRRRRAMSQEDLARRAGLTARSIRNLEGGSVRTPRPGTVRRLADGLALDGADRERFESAAVATYLGERDVGSGAGPVRPRFVVTEGMVSTPGGGLTVRWTQNPPVDAPDSGFCVTVRGFTPPHTARRPADLLRDVLDALGAHAQDIPAESATVAGSAPGGGGGPAKAARGAPGAGVGGGRAPDVGGGRAPGVSEGRATGAGAGSATGADAAVRAASVGAGLPSAGPLPPQRCAAPVVPQVGVEARVEQPPYHRRVQAVGDVQQ